jgi:hypothetical protein
MRPTNNRHFFLMTTEILNRNKYNLYPTNQSQNLYREFLLLGEYCGHRPDANDNKLLAQTIICTKYH